MAHLAKSEGITIGLHGPLGIGKSTVGAMLAESLGWPVLPEAFDANPHLAPYYTAIGLGLNISYVPVEEWFVESDFGRQQQAELLIAQGHRGVIVDKPGEGNYPWLQVSPMTEGERDYCRGLIRQNAEVRQPLTMVLELTAPVEHIAQNIINRGRPMEQNLPEGFLGNLNNEMVAYTASGKPFSNAPRMVVAMEKYDFVQRPDLIIHLRDSVMTAVQRGTRYSVFEARL